MLWQPLGLDRRSQVRILLRTLFRFDNPHYFVGVGLNSDRSRLNPGEAECIKAVKGLLLTNTGATRCS